MSTFTMNTIVSDYLTRINYPGLRPGDVPPPTLETLLLVHRQHCLTIPFENLSFVHHRMRATERPLDVPSLHKKLVLSGRGGMCQEMNGLLFFILRQLGFHCYQGLARVIIDGAPPRSDSANTGADWYGSGHRIIFTCVDRVWYLCDVGFGGNGIIEPMLLRSFDDAAGRAADIAIQAAATAGQQLPGAAAADVAGCPGESHQAGGRFRLQREPEPTTNGATSPALEAAAATTTSEAATAAAAKAHGRVVAGAAATEAATVSSAAGSGSINDVDAAAQAWWLFQAHIKEEWADQYCFTLAPADLQLLQTLSSACFRSHPLFTKKLVVTLPLEDGRITLTKFTLKIRRKGRETEQRVLKSVEERDALLIQLFGLQLTPVGSV